MIVREILFHQPNLSVYLSSTSTVGGPLSLLVETRLQLAAVTLTEEVHFTRAAERLGIPQAVLSKQIAEQSPNPS